jgi:hypothetical protein
MVLLIDVMTNGLLKIEEKLLAIKSKGNSKSKERKTMIDEGQS